MAEAVTLIGNVTPNVVANSDLRTKQFLCVQLFPDGVRVADMTNSPGNAVLVLNNKPNSGTACELVSLSNIARVFVGSTCNIGDWLAPIGATGLVGLSTSATVMAVNTSCIGFAMSAAGTGSGQLVSVWLRR